MAHEVSRGEIWLYRFAPPDRRRPVLVLSRPSLLRTLHTATVAAVTRTMRGAPTEVSLDVDAGLKGPSCVNLVNVFTVRKADLHRFVGVVPAKTMREVCDALAIAVGCD
jgi:mRNA interferase MazF